MLKVGLTSFGVLKKVFKKKVGVGLELWLSNLERRGVREEGLRTV